MTKALILALALVVWPHITNGEPPPQPDFTIKTHEKVDESGEVAFGAWTMNGIISDSGTVTAIYGYGFSQLWLDGEYGSMTIGAYSEYDPYTGKTYRSFWVDNGTGLYESWNGASGSFNAHYGPSSSGHNLKGYLP